MLKGMSVVNHFQTENEQYLGLSVPPCPGGLCEGPSPGRPSLSKLQVSVLSHSVRSNFGRLNDRMIMASMKTPTRAFEWEEAILVNLLRINDNRRIASCYTKWIVETL